MAKRTISEQLEYERKQKEALVAFAQKRSELAQEIMCAMVAVAEGTPDEVADLAIEYTDALMRRLYNINQPK